MYRWVDPEGQPTIPPPDPFDIMERKARGDYNILNEADERKVKSVPFNITNSYIYNYISAQMLLYLLLLLLSLVFHCHDHIIQQCESSAGDHYG